MLARDGPLLLGYHGPIPCLGERPSFLPTADALGHLLALILPRRQAPKPLASQLVRLRLPSEVNALFTQFVPQPLGG